MENSFFEINRICKKSFEEHFEENRKSALKALKYLDNSTAKYHGQTIYSLYVPKIFVEEKVEYLRKSAETMVRIMRKIIERYLEDEDYRKLFNFDKELEELILINPKYDNLLPIARVDIFLNELDNSFKFCEFNTDGSSSMNEDRELNIAFKFTEIYKALSEYYDLESFELFDSLVEEFMAIYDTYEFKKEKPNVAIVDFLELGCSSYEFEEFKKSFEKAGYKTEICEIRDLKFDGQKLYSPSGMEIDLIYRRAVTSDIFEHKNEVKDFIDAVKSEKVCLMGSFCTQVVHDKSLFYILNTEETFSFLTDEEVEFIKEHIPFTAELSDENIEKYNIFEDKDKWLIKPKNSYGARGIFAGVNQDDEKWKNIIAENKGDNYIMQEFIEPFKTLNFDFKENKTEMNLYSNLTGLYVYNGKFKGVYSRQSIHEIISSQYDENDVATVIARKKTK